MTSYHLNQWLEISNLMHYHLFLWLLKGIFQFHEFLMCYFFSLSEVVQPPSNFSTSIRATQAVPTSPAPSLTAISSTSLNSPATVLAAPSKSVDSASVSALQNEVSAMLENVPAERGNLTFASSSATKRSYTAAFSSRPSNGMKRRFRLKF